MGILNGEGYGRSIDERIEAALDDAYPSKSGFSSGYDKDRARNAMRREFGLYNEEDDLRPRLTKPDRPLPVCNSAKTAAQAIDDLKRIYDEFQQERQRLFEKLKNDS